MILFASACADTSADDTSAEPEELTQASAEITSSWTTCSSEWQHCSFTGTREVQYSSRGKSVVKTFTNGVDCRNDVFGDVDPGFTKSCAYGPVITSTPTSTPTPVSTTPTPAPTPVTTTPVTTTPVTTTPVTTTPVTTTPVTTTPVSTTPVTTTPVSTTVTLPPQLCTSPLALADSSHPTTVIGSGTAASCTESALRTAVANGGVITFNCGSAATTIKISQTLVAPSTKDTTIDGNNLVTLDGGGTTQILSSTGTDFRANDHVLTVQRLTMSNGHFGGGTFQARDGSKTCAWGYKGTGGGGAIYTSDVNLHVWGVTFTNNQGPSIGPDVGGGAIRMVGSKNLVVANSTFKSNSASNGGAIGVLHTASALYNTIFESNTATGILANFANDAGCPTFNHAGQGGAGGLGGAFYSDGFDPGDTFCGVRMSSNSSGDLGGAVFRSAYWGLMSTVSQQNITWQKTTFENNKSPTGGGGAAYVNNSFFTLTDVTFTGNDAGSSDGGGLKGNGLTLAANNVTFTNNKASWGGAVADWANPGPGGVGTATNIHYSGNLPNNAVGVFPQ